MAIKKTVKQDGQVVEILEQSCDESTQPGAIDQMVHENKEFFKNTSDPLLKFPPKEPSEEFSQEFPKKSQEEQVSSSLVLVTPRQLLLRKIEDEFTLKLHWHLPPDMTIGDVGILLAGLMRILEENLEEPESS